MAALFSVILRNHLLFMLFLQYLGYVTVICYCIILVKYIYSDVSEYQCYAYMDIRIYGEIHEH